MNFLQKKYLYSWFLLYTAIAICLIKILPIFIGNCQGDSDMCWKKYDSSLYLSIADQGYKLTVCDETVNLPKNKQTFCGNCGWAPLYPYLIKAILPWFPHAAAAGVFISFIFSMASMYLLLKHQYKQANPYYFLYGFLFLFFFGAVFYWAVFPISLTVFLLMCVLLNLNNQKPLLAGLFAMVLVWAYSSGMFILLALGIYFLGEWYKKGFKATKNSMFLAMGLPFLSLLLFFAFMHIKVGHWNALFLVQAKYGHGLQFPFKIIITYIKKLVADWGMLQMCIPFMYLLAMGLCIWFIWHTKKFNTKQVFLVLGICVAFFMLPFCLGTGLSLYRSMALLSPLLLFTNIKKRWQMALSIVVLACLYFPLFKMFTTDLLN